MTCDRCEGKGIVLSQEVSAWAPMSWDGAERRRSPRQAQAPKFKEVPAPFYMTCEACGGLGQILPGLLSPFHSK